MIGTAALAAISFGGKPIGYLARIGPAPLRYQAPAKGPEVTVMLPPLVMSDPPAPPHEVTTNETVTVEAPVQPAPAPAPAPAPVVAEPAFTPQMLLPYFKSNGTNQEPAVILPYQFTPPAAPVIPAPPSKATYTKQ
jgi:translation initiation factor IF-2